jgi:hypothetical protein
MAQLSQTKHGINAARTLVSTDDSAASPEPRSFQREPEPQQPVDPPESRSSDNLADTTAPDLTQVLVRALAAFARNGNHDDSRNRGRGQRSGDQHPSRVRPAPYRSRSLSPENRSRSQPFSNDTLRGDSRRRDPTSSQAPIPRDADKTCFGCGQRGHIRARCPQAPKRLHDAICHYWAKGVHCPRGRNCQYKHTQVFDAQACSFVLTPEGCPQGCLCPHSHEVYDDTPDQE